MAYPRRGCRGKAGRRPRRPVCSERGNRLGAPLPPASQVGNGKARRQPMAPRRDGASVVVRGRKAGDTAKGGSEFAACDLECQDFTGEHRRAVPTIEGQGDGYWVSSRSCISGPPTPVVGSVDLDNLVIDPAVPFRGMAPGPGQQGARSAGVDGQTAHDIETARGRGEVPRRAASRLKARTFRPCPCVSG